MYISTHTELNNYQWYFSPGKVQICCWAPTCLPCWVGQAYSSLHRTSSGRSGNFNAENYAIALLNADYAYNDCHADYADNADNDRHADHELSIFLNSLNFPWKIRSPWCWWFWWQIWSLFVILIKIIMIIDDHNSNSGLIIIFLFAELPLKVDQMIIQWFPS